MGASEANESLPQQMNYKNWLICPKSRLFFPQTLIFVLTHFSIFPLLTLLPPLVTALAVLLATPQLAILFRGWRSCSASGTYDEGFGISVGSFAPWFSGWPRRGHVSAASRRPNSSRNFLDLLFSPARKSVRPMNAAAGS